MNMEEAEYILKFEYIFENYPQALIILIGEDKVRVIIEYIKFSEKISPFCLKYLKRVFKTFSSRGFMGNQKNSLCIKINEMMERRNISEKEFSEVSKIPLNMLISILNGGKIRARVFYKIYGTFLYFDKQYFGKFSNISQREMKELYRIGVNYLNESFFEKVDYA